MELPPEWEQLPANVATQLLAELHRELPSSHLLHGQPLRAVARWKGRDDVLFESTSHETRVYWVHLTWNTETDPHWPWTIAFESRAHFASTWRNELGDIDDTAD